jgi:hypothetical protein
MSNRTEKLTHYLKYRSLLRSATIIWNIFQYDEYLTKYKETFLIRSVINFATLSSHVQ